MAVGHHIRYDAVCQHCGRRHLRNPSSLLNPNIDGFEIAIKTCDPCEAAKAKAQLRQPQAPGKRHRKWEAVN